MADSQRKLRLDRDVLKRLTPKEAAGVWGATTRPCTNSLCVDECVYDTNVYCRSAACTQGGETCASACADSCETCGSCGDSCAPTCTPTCNDCPTEDTGNGADSCANCSDTCTCTAQTCYQTDCYCDTNQCTLFPACP